MKEIRGNIWDYFDKGNWICITTNGNVKKDGKAVMGAGIAGQAKRKYPEIAQRLGELIKQNGSIVQVIDSLGDGRGIIAFPTKYSWSEDADIALIKLSAYKLSKLIPNDKKVYLPRPGCDFGNLTWKQVKPIIEEFLDDRFIIVDIYG